MKTENPRMNFVLKLFRLQNCRKLRPTEPIHARSSFFKARITVLSKYVIELEQIRNLMRRFFKQYYTPTYAKKRQYRAATMGAGMDAKTAPNLPEINTRNDSLIKIQMLSL